MGIRLRLVFRTLRRFCRGRGWSRKRNDDFLLLHWLNRVNFPSTVFESEVEVALFGFVGVKPFGGNFSKVFALFARAHNRNFLRRRYVTGKAGQALDGIGRGIHNIMAAFSQELLKLKSRVLIVL